MARLARLAGSAILAPIPCVKRGPSKRQASANRSRQYAGLGLRWQAGTRHRDLEAVAKQAAVQALRAHSVRLLHYPAEVLGKELLLNKDTLTGEHKVASVLPESKAAKAGVEVGMLLRSLTFSIELNLKEGIPVDYTAIATCRAEHELPLIDDVLQHFIDKTVASSEQALFHFSSDMVLHDHSSQSCSTGMFHQPSTSLQPWTNQAATYAACQQATDEQENGGLLALPSDSLQGDTEILLVKSGTSLKVHAALLREASPTLSQALDSAAAQHAARPPADLITQSLLPLAVTLPQAHALLQALYSKGLAGKLAWAAEQPLAVLRDLADVAYALECPDLLRLADTVLADRATMSPSASPAMGACILLTPANSMGLLLWASALGLEAFPERAEQALEQFLPVMPSHMRAEVFAELHPAVVRRFLAQLQQTAEKNLVHAQALLQGGDRQGAAFILSRAIKAIGKMAC